MPPSPPEDPPRHLSTPDDRPVQTRSTSGALAGWLKREALALGFHRAGIALPPPDPAVVASYRRWLEQGYHGEMDYLARPEAVARRADPSLTLSDVRCVLVVTHRYAGNGDPPRVPRQGDGHIARYARGRDYHGVIRERLEGLHRRLEDHLGRAVRGRAYTDAGPLLERDLARRAGLGWIGKNTMMLHPRAGSWELLGALLLALDLPPDDPFNREHCGRCTSCLDGCPTGALRGRDEQGAPVMDARRCISYFTIEAKGPIPQELRAPMGTRIFGCDICQEVCPWNGEKAATGWPPPDAAYAPREILHRPDLVSLAERILPLSGKGFLREFAESPLARTRRQGLLRNLCVAMGNVGGPECVPVLRRALMDPHPLVRGHAAWALGRIGTTEARIPLLLRQEEEGDPWVMEELRGALAMPVSQGEPGLSHPRTPPGP
jgi:epoxyqueuosine reductase